MSPSDDPEFLPLILTDPTLSEGFASAHFGASVAVSGSLVAVSAPNDYGYPDEGHVYLYQTSDGSNLSIPNPICCADNFGASIALGNGLVVIGAPLAEDFYLDVGQAFIYDTSNGTRLTTLLSPTPTSGGEFGSSVAISGDLVVVGAPFENESTDSLSDFEAGHAYVFNLESHSVLMLSDPDPQEYAKFGSSVAIDGDLVAVGAPNEASGAGAVYLFNAETGDLLANLSNPAEGQGSNFGTSVAVNGSNVIVGAPGGSESGFATVFFLATGTNVTLVSPDGALAGGFGTSVAMDSQWVAVGAPNESAYDSGRADVGNAYVFTTTGGDQLFAAVTAPDWPVGTCFGCSVALNSSSLVVGAQLSSAGDHSDAGHAYLFNRLPLTFYPNGVPGSDLNDSVSINATTLVGVPGAPDGIYSDSGAAYLRRSLGSPVMVLDDPVGASGDEFGFAVAANPTWAVVGAPGQEGGTVYVYNASSGSRLYAITNPNGPSGRFGAELAISGNLLLISAPTYILGAVFLWNLSSDKEVQEFDALDGPGWGDSIAISGGNFVVGVPGANAGEGDVWVYGITNLTAWSRPILEHPSDGLAVNEGSDFGDSVALSGDTLLVGAPGALTIEGSGETSGLAIDLSLTSPAIQHTLLSLNPVQGGEFGCSVGLGGGVGFVGACDENPWGVSQAGSVYLYNLTTLEPIDRYNSPTPFSDQEFGNALAVGPGGTLVVGDAPGTDTAGSAEIFFF